MLSPYTSLAQVNRSEIAEAHILRLSNRTGLLVTLLAASLGVVWAFAIKPLNAPDEPMHLQAVMHVRNLGTLPEVHYDFREDPDGRVINTYIDEATQAYGRSLGMSDTYRSLEVTDAYALGPHQNIQQPLYYALTGFLAMFVPNDPQVILYLARLVSVLFGIGAVYFCWAATKELAPREPLLALVIASLVALLPQFSFIRASASNDSAVIFAGMAFFYVSFRGLRQPNYDPWMWKAGAIVGIGLLAKLTAISLLPGLALVVLFRAYQRMSRTAINPNLMVRRQWLHCGLRMSAGAGVSLLLISGWSFIRNLLVYGDVTGLGNAIEYNALRLPLQDFTEGWVRTLFINSTWQSFIGIFGWRTVRLPTEIYTIAAYLFALLSIFTLVFVISRLLHSSKERRESIARTGSAPNGFAQLSRCIPAYVWQASAVMLAVSMAVMFNYVRYSMVYNFQPQARHLFLLLLPFALCAYTGLYFLTRSNRARLLFLSLPLAALAAVNLVGVYIVATFLIRP